MSNLILHREQSQAIVLPPPRGGDIDIRVGVEADLPFIDQWQKKHTKMVGFLKLPVLRGHLKHGRILIAEQFGKRVGYCLATDRYFKRDDCGIVYQLNVVSDKQRGLIGATLIKEVFHRASYACKLFCCWCAQDLEANYFWESLGFVPLAFRTGSRRVKRMDGTTGPRTQIFWQRRIREGDETTPYWFPAETSNGSIGENRIALPIPPGTSWQDAKPAVLPGMERLNEPQLPAALSSGEGQPAPDGRGSSKSRSSKPKVAAAPAKPRINPKSISMGALRFAAPPTQSQKVEKPKEPKPKPKREKPARFKNDPKLVELARELSAKYLDQVNAGLLLPPSACGKYDVSRQLEAAPSFRGAMKIEQVPGDRLLDAA